MIEHEEELYNLFGFSKATHIHILTHILTRMYLQSSVRMRFFVK